MDKRSPTIEEWPLYRAGSLSEVWSESTTKAPFSYSVVPEDFASGLVPNLEDSESLATDREQKLLVASADAEPVGFAHICAGPAEVRGEDTECGIIRCLAFVPDFPVVGQLLLESAEGLLTDYGYIDAFTLYHGYSFHNYKVGVLSDRLAHVRKLFSENGYTPHDAHLTLERRIGKVTPVPIAAQVNVEKVPTHAERPNIFVRAFSGDSRIGICRMFSCQTYAHLDELASCCYLRWLGVDQEYRRQGIGHYLLNRALSEAQEDGYERVILNCRENNIAAVSLYTRVGFRILGCGAGRLLIAYLQDGLDVEGVDISADQLAVCRRDAERVGVKPVLYEQSMQTFDVPHSYSTIYIPCGSFECVMDRAEALETLRRCFTHLEPKGQLVFACSPGNRNYYGNKEEAKTYPGEWTLRSNKELPDGRRLLVYLRDTGEDAVEQIQMQERRYEIHDGDQVIEEEVHAGQTRWYHRNEVLWMLQLAGFADVEVKGNFSDAPLNAEHTDMIFVATKPAG